MAIRARSVLAAGVVLLAAACGTTTSGPPAPVNTAPAGSAKPAITVMPDTALTGGQPLRVRMSGFPPDSTVELRECVAPGACDSNTASYFGTGRTGSASVTFIAQPSVQVDATTKLVRCARQCALTALVIKGPAGTGARPTAVATARLAFATVSPADLAHSSLLDASWISATEGWALAAQPCVRGTCIRLARTTDGGQHWQRLADPPARIGDGGIGCRCVSAISFVTRAIGYLYGPALLMTTDGGRTWQAQPGPQTEALSIVSGQVFRVTYISTGCPGPCQPSLLEAPAGSARWRTLIGALGEPGRSDSAQIAGSGPDVLVALYGSLAGPIPAQAVVYRSTDYGGTWQRAADPCNGLGPRGPRQEEDLIALAAAPGGFFAGLCAPHASAGTFVITSADAGLTWRPTAARPRGAWLGSVAAASPAVIAVAGGPTSGGGTYTTALLVTTDGGRHWFSAATDTQDLTTGNAPAALDFESLQAGHWLADPHGIWATTDAGLHWTRTAFR